VAKLARRVDRMAAIFPFEPRCYAGTGLPVDYVGHPLLDRLGDIAAASDRASARRRLGLPEHAPVVALMPGSRRNEVSHGLAVFVKTAQIVHAREPRSWFVLPVAPSLDSLRLESAVRRLPGAASLPVRFVTGEAITALAACDVALQKPGTATLEATVLGRPMVVAARLHPVTAAIVRRAAAVDCTAMPNLIAGRRIVPEFLQAEAEPAAIAGVLLQLLAGPERELQLAELAAVRRTLGPAGAARRTAAIAAEMLSAGRRS
jgi:lipid-A-disaccharide synthase